MVEVPFYGHFPSAAAPWSALAVTECGQKKRKKYKNLLSGRGEPERHYSSLFRFFIYFSPFLLSIHASSQFLSQKTLFAHQPHFSFFCSTQSTRDQQSTNQRKISPITTSTWPSNWFKKKIPFLSHQLNTRNVQERESKK